MTVLQQRDGSVMILTIDRPAVRNALDIATMKSLGSAVADAITDPQVRVIILTGSGEKAFSAGGDIDEMSRHAGLQLDTAMASWEETLRIIETSPKPVIAAIHGFALGGGTEVAMACHIRLASETAQLGQTEIMLDHLPGAGGTQRLPRLIPVGLAYEYLLTGDHLSAVEAHRLGLVNRVFPVAELMPEALALAHRIAQRSPTAIRMTLEAIRLGLQGSLDAGLRLERALASITLESSEAIDGLQKFLEQRSARKNKTPN